MPDVLIAKARHLSRLIAQQRGRPFNFDELAPLLGKRCCASPVQPQDMPLVHVQVSGEGQTVFGVLAYIPERNIVIPFASTPEFRDLTFVGREQDKVFAGEALEQIHRIQMSS